MRVKKGEIQRIFDTLMKVAYNQSMAECCGPSLEIFQMFFLST